MSNVAGREQCPSKVKNRVGEVYGQLTVCSLDRVKDGKSYWKCLCSCGNETTVQGSRLKVKKSCGCLSKNSQFTKGDCETHAMSETRVYKIWGSMIQRTTNPNHARYIDYGGRGITVSDEWKNFINFYNDMGNPPSVKHTLERVNNLDGYHKDNCKWATRSEQQSNRVTKSTSGRVGVKWCSQTDKWKASFTANGVYVWLGRFDNFEDACDAIEKEEIIRLGYSRSKGFTK